MAPAGHLLLSVPWRFFSHGSGWAPTIVGAIEVLPSWHWLGTNIVGAMEVLPS